MNKGDIIEIYNQNFVQDNQSYEGEAILISKISPPYLDDSLGWIEENPIEENGKIFEFWKVRFTNDDYIGIRKIELTLY